jgi:hypothetical protein
MWLQLVSSFNKGRTSGAHSCGAVAEFHRLPEHPDDCGFELRRSPSLSSSDVINPISMISSFIAEAGDEVKKTSHN